MKKIPILLLSLLSFWNASAAETASLRTQPERIIQGDPVLITIEGIPLSKISGVRFDALPVPFFIFRGKPAAFVGVDLNATPGNHIIKVILADGAVVEQTAHVEARAKEELPLGIPETLGGNTPASQKKLISSLEKENRILSSLATNKKKLWTEPFTLPVKNPVVVDPYGYSRETGEYTIAHKGTDFRAPKGTEIYAMNRGVVRLAKYSPVYGNMIVIDHGLGLMTFYMHLSKLSVKTGQLVAQGERIGLSGDTGYALGPHLHLTVRLNKTSIDPMQFMRFFQ